MQNSNTTDSRQYKTTRTIEISNEKNNQLEQTATKSINADRKPVFVLPDWFKFSRSQQTFYHLRITGTEQGTQHILAQG